MGRTGQPASQAPAGPDHYHVVVDFKAAYTSLTASLTGLGLKLVPDGVSAAQTGNVGSITDYTVEHVPDSLGGSRMGVVTATVQIRIPSKTDDELLDLANTLGTTLDSNGFQNSEVKGASLTYEGERILTVTLEGVYIVNS